MPIKTLSTGDLKYSAYNMDYNEQTDEYKLYLAYYIEIYKNAGFVLMRHDTRTGPQKYFKGIISDTICCLIDSTFLNRTYNSDYIEKMDTPVIYDGFTYCFDYKKKNGEKSKIRYIPPYSPDRVKILGSALDSLIYKTTKSNIDSFSLVNYIRVLEKLSSSNLPRRVQFQPPK
jgi:hypothetical protein